MSPRALVLLLGLATALVVQLPAHAYTNGGVEGNGRDGCGQCHGGRSPEPAVRVTIEGFPASFQAGQTYSVTVRVTGPDVRGNGVKAGFAADPEGGQLRTTDGNTRVLTRTLTQTTAGAAETSWDFEWVAPTSGLRVARLYTTGLLVHDKGRGLLDDPWNVLTTSSALATSGESPAVGVLGGVVLLLGAALLLRPTR